MINVYLWIESLSGTELALLLFGVFITICYLEQAGYYYNIMRNLERNLKRWERRN
jgi:hypothetical protein